MFRNLAGLTLAAFVVSAGSALANGFSESSPWQFRSASERANAAVVLDIIERKKGGYYDGFDSTTNITNNITENFAGDQINCNVSASATGNASSGSMDAAAGTANVSSTITNEANTTGNEAVNSVGTPGGNSVAFGILNDQNGQPGSTYTVADLINNDQGVNDSNLDSSADGNTNSFDGGTVSGGDDSSTSQVLNNDQDNDGNQSASVNDSTACSFENTGTGDGGQ